MMELVVLEEEEERSEFVLSALPEHTVRRGYLHARKQFSLGTESSSTWILDFEASSSKRNKCVV